MGEGFSLKVCIPNLELWDKDKKWVTSLGSCPLDGGVFEKNFAIKAPLEKHLKVTHHIEGCPPTPKAIMIGLLEFLKKI